MGTFFNVFNPILSIASGANPSISSLMSFSRSSFQLPFSFFSLLNIFFSFGNYLFFMFDFINFIDVDCTINNTLNLHLYFMSSFIEICNSFMVDGVMELLFFDFHHLVDLGNHFFLGRHGSHFFFFIYHWLL